MNTVSKMNKEILLLRLSYWATAIADFYISAIVLIPERMAVSETVYPMGLLSVIAFSWAILLLMADRKPLERRWVLIPTIIVVGLLTSVRLVFVLNDAIEFSGSFLLLGISLIALMGYSYFSAGKVTVEKRPLG